MGMIKVTCRHNTPENTSKLGRGIKLILQQSTLELRVFCKHFHCHYDLIGRGLKKLKKMSPLDYILFR
jgi:hypothetical protein